MGDVGRTERAFSYLGIENDRKKYFNRVRACDPSGKESGKGLFAAKNAVSLGVVSRYVTRVEYF